LLLAIWPAVFLILSSGVEGRAPEVTGMEEVLSDLQALKGLYGLLHKGHQANENVRISSTASKRKKKDFTLLKRFHRDLGVVLT
jgi:hypothetical protein